MTSALDSLLTTLIGDPVGVATELAERLVRARYGIESRAERLTGERDENFRMTAADGARYVFKVANAHEESLITELPTAALLHLETADPTLPCPRVLRSVAGETQIRFSDARGIERTGRLVTYLPGRPLSAASRSAAQRAACGRLAARMGRALCDFEHPAMHRPLIWDVRVLPRLRPLLTELPDVDPSGVLGRCMDEFTQRVVPRLARLRQQFIHNDLNSNNVLVDPTDESRIAGVIDFGDAIHNALIVDVAIAAVAQITRNESAAADTTDLVRGYHEIQPLLPDELEILYPLIAARMTTGILIPTWHRARNPGAEHFAALSAEHLRRRFELIQTLNALKPIHV